MSFREKLAHAAETNRTLLCVGLDPDPARVPGEKTAGFLSAVVAATSDLVCAYKPNLAFYEQLGEAGYAALRAVLKSKALSISRMGHSQNQWNRSGGGIQPRAAEAPRAQCTSLHVGMPCS